MNIACYSCVIVRLGAWELPVRGTGDTTRVLHVDRRREGLGTVVEESHLQGDRTHGRHHPGVLQVAQLDAAVAWRIIMEQWQRNSQCSSVARADTRVSVACRVYSFSQVASKFAKVVRIFKLNGVILHNFAHFFKIHLQGGCYLYMSPSSLGNYTVFRRFWYRHFLPDLPPPPKKKAAISALYCGPLQSDWGRIRPTCNNSPRC